ncbi:MAG: hypothetical protein AABY18_07605 [Candidatus Thermoplasmatota archaeon]|mgnify:CR=1 FL=1
MSALEANAAVAAGVILTGLSLLLLAVGVVSYTRLRHGRLLWVSVAFLVMAAQGLYLTVLAYKDRAAISGGDLSLGALAVVNLGVVIALYLAVLKR